MSKIKLIACDLDGTLLLNGAQNCDEDTFPLLKELTDRGIYFVPASGRQYYSLTKLFAPVQERLAYLCENGAVVIYKDEVLYSRKFEQKLSYELSHMVIDDPRCEVQISGERTCYLVPKSDDFVSYIRGLGNHVAIVKRPEDVPEPIIKVSFFTDEDYLKEAGERFGRMCKDRCQMMVSGNRWIDFAPFGTGKGEALKSLGEILDIAPEEMAAFGDNENDRTMLEMAGHPYIMENCNPAIRDIPGMSCRRVADTLKEILSVL